MTFKRYCCPELKLEKIFKDYLKGLKIAILANLGQLTR